MSVIEEYQKLIGEALIEHSLLKLEPIELYEPCDYLMSVGGKRLRPVILMLGSYIFGGNVEDVLKPAIGIEYFHNFTLMHDDIMDHSPLRRGKETVHVKYNVNTGILSGDALLIKAYQMFEDLEPAKYKKVMSLFSKTAAELCEGQQYDMNFETQDTLDFDEYIKMIMLKTGVMMGASLQIGAMIADADEKDYKYIYDFGKNLGIAFQLKDDYLDIFGEKGFGKIHGGDVLENKKTVLYFKAKELAKGDDLKELLFWYGMQTDNIDKVYAVEKIFRKSRVDVEAMNLVSEYTAKAMENLDKIDAPEDRKNELRELAAALIDRRI